MDSTSSYTAGCNGPRIASTRKPCHTPRCRRLAAHHASNAAGAKGCSRTPCKPCGCTAGSRHGPGRQAMLAGRHRGRRQPPAWVRPAPNPHAFHASSHRCRASLWRSLREVHHACHPRRAIGTSTSVAVHGLQAGDATGTHAGESPCADALRALRLHYAYPPAQCGRA